MNNIKFGANDYSRLDEIEKLVNSINNLVLGYNKSTRSKEQDVRSLNGQINKKSKSIENANRNTLNLTKKLEELEELREATKKRVKDLENEKANVSFSNSDIQKMEMQELSEQIASKNAKIEKLNNLVEGTKSSISNNNKELNELKSELNALESAKKAAEKSLKRTEALIELINETNKEFISSVREILSKEFFNKKEEVEAPVKPEPQKKEEKKEENPKEKIEKKAIIDKPEKKEEKEDPKPKEMEESLINVPEEPKEPKFEKPDEQSEIKIPVVSEPSIKVPDAEEKKEDKSDFSILDSWEKDLQGLGKEEPTVEVKEEEKDSPLNADAEEKQVNEESKKDEELTNTGIINQIINEKNEEDEKSAKVELPAVEKPSANIDNPNAAYDKIKEIFSKESISFDDFDGETQKTLNDNIDQVKKNLEILKNHKVPLNLTIKQPRIYYGINETDLNDLLSIITTDEGGNGMGFDISYVYFCLDELSKTDVDKLIDVYNKEFMNITSKSGIIKLLKDTNPNLGDFKATIEENKKILKDYGINNPDEVEKECKAFIEIDNPLFMDILNVFDKDDLVQKINSDPKIADQILEYWKNN